MADSICCEILTGGIWGNKEMQSRCRALVRGDVVWVKCGIFKWHGIWMGDSVIFYGKNCHGISVVHEASFEDFLQGADEFGVCEFPDKTGGAMDWLEESILDEVMVRNKVRQIMERMKQEDKYKCYSHEKTALRAESQIGSDGFVSSEHFAVWCKLGIAEPHEISSMADFGERMLVYSIYGI